MVKWRIKQRLGKHPWMGRILSQSQTSTDAASVKNYIVLSPSDINISGTISNASCGLNNGSINITVSGGTPGYSYAWSNGSSAEDQNNLAAGSYTVTVY
ncbi:hypothetical protein MASR1M65_14250 [Saprospiraceae bacterium]